MNHDPMCMNQPEYFDGSILWPARCDCELIRKVRADERDNCWGAVAEIAADELWDGAKTAWWIVKADALAAIDALREGMS